jgi:hypothetical protein
MIQKLIEIARNGPNTAKLAAIQQLLDRALGKPESRAEIEHVSQDEDPARAFAALLVERYPEIAEAAFRGALPDVVDAAPALPAPARVPEEQKP